MPGEDRMTTTHLGLLPFESHAIELPGGVRTIPGAPLLADTPLCGAALRALRAFCPIVPGRPAPTVLDVGCREGGFALEFARAGYRVTGLEARPSNVARCEMVAEAAGMEHLSFVCDDARNIGAHGEFDAVFHCGLLYHLDRPVEHLREVGAVTRRLLILNTHYADWPPSPEFELSPMTRHEGVLGKWYVDLAPGTTHEQMEQNRGASWGNEHSFWLERRHLLDAIGRAGFDMVLEQHDFLGDVLTEAETWWDRQQRSQFLGVRAPAA
jgi:SAM-dependent methyltransferase